ncbi:hypothetical protein JIN85_19580 [Luteolibacter pohnpeiensis]|uniref:Uncharacterized protein n=1 Tax=Luteolibacter pohnpeiensis TaxID=454153 RepID=A0A934S9I8_9BACT|nr:hypothetical protein [Luteolibacter pohnpeiensis]MBK1884627.1 hypothetical protein [Luteolibacter pohnpeiensis]
MKSFTLGFPPDGQSVDPYSGDSKIPESIRDEVIRRYEAEYPGGYVLAFVDHAAGIAGFYTRTKENWQALNDIYEVVLYPTKPEKDSGFLVVGSQDTTPGWPNNFFLSSSRYTDRLHEWVRIRSERFAGLIGRPFREAMAGSDC